MRHCQSLPQLASLPFFSASLLRHFLGQFVHTTSLATARTYSHIRVYAKGCKRVHRNITRLNTRSHTSHTTADTIRHITAHTKSHTTADTIRQATAHTRSHTTPDTTCHTLAHTRGHTKAFTTRHITADTRSHTTAETTRSQPFTKPPLLQESRLTDGGSPNLVGLVEGKVPVEWEWELQIVSIDLIHDCTHVLYKQLIPTGFGCYSSDFTLSRAFHSTRTQTLG